GFTDVRLPADGPGKTDGPGQRVPIGRKDGDALAGVADVATLTEGRRDPQDPVASLADGATAPASDVARSEGRLR
ncbi:MAG: hypothetical protein J2P58_13415, partial [Acidimicrobiaceae bacterium]|nr:hypothetical protein [Acidimicrobiaceae bacterium]